MQHPGDATADQPADDATGATTSERWLSASSWTRKRFASWDRKACSCAHPCRCVRRKIGRFGVPVLYRSGASRPMKMGTIASPWRYDAAAADAIRLDNLRRTAVLRYASWAGCLFDFAGGSVTLRSRLFRL